MPAPPFRLSVREGRPAHAGPPRTSAKTAPPRLGLRLQCLYEFSRVTPYGFATLPSMNPAPKSPLRPSVPAARPAADNPDRDRQVAQRVLTLEAEAIQALAQGLGATFPRALDLLHRACAAA